nr:probable LRR receptor-like serine/threonine-protein kinase At1g07650 isoform X1 [Ipomoea batatas]
MFVFIFLLLCFNPIGIRAQTPALPLPDSERNALSEIADQLGKKGWNFSLNPCDGDPSWNTPPQDAWPIYQNSVLCNCTYSDGFCHVENMLDFDPPNHKKKTLIIAVSVAASLVAILIILGIAWRKRYLKSRISKEQELMGLDLKTGFFTFRQIKAATDNFSVANKLGEGGFGAVYKGTLLDGTIVAVKQLSSKSKQGNREFVNEIGMISGLQHPNVVRLYGCCIEGNQLLLVYEYVENNSLARALFGPQESRLQIDWPTRQRICVGIAKGLAFLHEEGYMAPEYALWGYLTYKVDVYSFGVMALEIAAGKNNMKFRPDESYVCLLDWALVVQKKGSLLELVDSQLGSDFNKEEAIRMIKVALICTNPSPALRPTMSAVVRMLEGEADVNDLSSDATMYGDDLHFQSLREKYDEMQSRSSERHSFFQSSNARTGDVPSSSSF